MRHLGGYRKLGRKTPHRKAMLRNMATSLVMHERIQTTLPRAKELKTVVEKLITTAKKGGLSARRALGSYLFGHEAPQKACTDLAKRFASTPGGYLRIIKQTVRKGDHAETATLEFIDFAPKKK